MTIEFSLICGVNIGVEYIQADEELGIENSCFVIDLLIFRVVLELIDR